MSLELIILIDTIVVRTDIVILSGMPFTKMHALGNDYIVLDGSHEGAITAHGIRDLCDRHHGIGADGVLLGPLVARSGADAACPSFGLRIFNSDGSECEKSGNGLRMFAAYLRRHHTRRDDFNIALPGETCRATIVDKDEGIVTIDMGQAQLVGTRLTPPMAPDCSVEYDEIHLGNPHSVVFLDGAPRAEDARDLGPRISMLSTQSPRGSNVQFCQVVDKSTLRIEIWERGAGYTLASGSSACAAAAAAHLRGKSAPAVTVHMPGGALDIEIGQGSADNSLPLKMTGRATFVFDGLTS